MSAEYRKHPLPAAWMRSQKSWADGRCIFLYVHRNDSRGVPLLTLSSGGKGQLRSIMTHLSDELRLGWVRSGLVWHQGLKGD